MRFSRDAWRQLLPLFPTGPEVKFDYHDHPRSGTIDTIGEGPRGAFMTVLLSNGEYKSFSLAKVRNLRVADVHHAASK